MPFFANSNQLVFCFFDFLYSLISKIKWSGNKILSSDSWEYQLCKSFFSYLVVFHIIYYLRRHRNHIKVLSNKIHLYERVMMSTSLTNSMFTFSRLSNEWKRICLCLLWHVYCIWLLSVLRCVGLFGIWFSFSLLQRQNGFTVIRWM